MTTTVESNMLNMHQSPMVLGWGQNAINASYPINAKRLQIVFPSSGKVRPWIPNQNIEFRQLLDKNSAMSLHGSYFQISYSIGRVTDWNPKQALAPANAQGAQPTEAKLQPLDPTDRACLYTHWNPCRLLQNCTLWLGSTNVETVNNVPLVTDAKYAFYSQDAVKSTMSDCFVLPVDGMTSINGAPLIHANKNPTLTNMITQWHDSSIFTFAPYSIQPKNDTTNGASAVTPPVAPGTAIPYCPALAYGPVLVEPLEYFLRNAVYAVPVGIQYNDLCTSVWNTVTIPFTIFTSAITNGDGNISYWDYGNESNPSLVPTVAGGITEGTAYPIEDAKNTLTEVTKRIPLSELFGFCEANVLVPSNLIQINLVRARDDQFMTNLWFPTFTQAGPPGAVVSAVPRTYAICVTNIYLVLKYYDLNQTAADLLSQDQLLTVNHYSVYSNEISAQAAGSGSVSLQSYAGLKSLLIRINPSWAAAGQSIAVAQSGNISVIYRGKQSPLQLQQWNVQLTGPVAGGAVSTYQGGPMIRSDPSTYFEEYSSWNGNCWNGVSASLAPSAGFSLATWFKSQFTLAFNFVEDQSMNADTVAAPIQLNYNLGGDSQYDITQNTNGTGIRSLPDAVFNAAKNTIQVVFLRTNIIKYLGASRQFVFVTNGSS